MNPISSFKEMSTGKKVAVVAGTAAAAAGVGLTTAAYLRGKNIDFAKNFNVKLENDVISLTRKDGAEKTKFITKLKDGFASIFKGDARSDYKTLVKGENDIATKTQELLNFQEVTDEAGKKVGKFNNEDIKSGKQLKKLSGLLKKFGNEKQVETVKSDAFQQAQKDAIKAFKNAAKAKAPETPTETPVTPEVQVEGQNK